MRLRRRTAEAAVPTCGGALSAWGQRGPDRGRWQFIPAEEFGFVLRSRLHIGIMHFGHGYEGLRVVVGGVPEQEANPAFLFRRRHLHLDVLRRISFGAPVEGLQPGPD